MSAAARVGESHPPALSFGSLKTSGFRTFSVSDIASMGAVAQRYTLAPVASRIKQPVLILAGAEDHSIPPSRQVARRICEKVTAGLNAAFWSNRSG